MKCPRCQKTFSVRREKCPRCELDNAEFRHEQDNPAAESHGGHDDCGALEELKSARGKMRRRLGDPAIKDKDADSTNLLQSDSEDVLSAERNIFDRVQKKYAEDRDPESTYHDMRIEWGVSPDPDDSGPHTPVGRALIDSTEESLEADDSLDIDFADLLVDESES